ncbi:Ni/Fe hydrogenase subunit alpha [Candidatus Woesearchaeota archaeon]|nr:Ni/Fe hydrogenase subunit alpha [Candidatus Woesearchaeota archaeon]
MPKTITLNHITKIEGHAKLEIGVERGGITKCQLSAVEGSRYFEGLVRGRKFFEAHEITSRICGICSCAHVIAAISAVEDALNYKPSEQTLQLRKLLTLGERIRSHATHLYFLALPDYLGYESALAMASKYRPQLQNALNLMKTGNLAIKIIGGRDLHPVSATVGGWLKLPKKSDLLIIGKQLESAKADAIKTCKLFFSLKYPEFQSRTECFSLIDKNSYAVLEGEFSSEKISFRKSQYKEFINEYHEPRSTANFVVKSDHRYMVGALSRLNNSHRKLSKNAKKMLKLSKIRLPSKNPYLNNVAQAIEIVHCIDEAIRICENLNIRSEAVEKPKLKAGNGVGAIEVPRGTLWHDYTINDNGVITNANIITPTAQNLLNIQEDIRDFVPSVASKRKEKIVLEVEKLIRSYDPCFSCSAHFLEVKWS